MVWHDHTFVQGTNIKTVGIEVIYVSIACMQALKTSCWDPGKVDNYSSRLTPTQVILI